MADVSWLFDVLRQVVPVVEHPGWRSRGNGILAPRACVWHHDGSPPGASPNVPRYIATQVEAGKPGANIWVGLDGTWHLIAAGLTYHAGPVLPGKPDNSTSFGIETDHTTGESWSGVDLLGSLRVGTAAILRHLGVGPAGGLEFHKTICSPVGRKNDPDGLVLSTEQAAVADIMQSEEDDMRYKDWPLEDKMLLANDITNAVLTKLGEKDPTTTAGDRLKKAAHASQHLHDHAGLTD